jgi:hypothetical protein
MADVFQHRCGVACTEYSHMPFDDSYYTSYMSSASNSSCGHLWIHHLMLEGLLNIHKVRYPIFFFTVMDTWSMEVHLLPHLELFPVTRLDERESIPVTFRCECNVITVTPTPHAPNHLRHMSGISIRCAPCEKYLGQFFFSFFSFTKRSPHVGEGDSALANVWKVRIQPRRSGLVNSYEYSQVLWVKQNTY